VIKIWEAMAYLHEERAKRQGVTAETIGFARGAGMDPRDVAWLEAFTLRESYLLIFRCPKLEARAWYTVLKPKIAAVKAKTGSSGAVVDEKGRLFVSDYDMMSAYRLDDSSRPTKLRVTGTDPAKDRSPFSPTAADLVRRLNKGLIARIQHGAQDDWNSPKNRGVDLKEDRFAVFERGLAQLLRDGHEARAFYANRGLTWPYDDRGSFLLG
jgi:hypothetical protein